MSGIDLADGRAVRKGAASAVSQWTGTTGGTVPDDLGPLVDGISAACGTPLVVEQYELNEGHGRNTDAFAAFLELGIGACWVSIQMGDAVCE